MLLGALLVLFEADDRAELAFESLDVLSRARKQVFYRRAVGRLQGRRQESDQAQWQEQRPSHRSMVTQAQTVFNV
jgi:hypothetical protein